MAPPLSTFSLFLFLLSQQHSSTIVTVVAFTDTNNTETTQPPNPIPQHDATPFIAVKPSIAIVISVIASIFSLTFLLILYIKYINTTTDSSSSITGGGNGGGGGGRKNSGVYRCVVESLPIFRFGSLIGEKDGLDCAVCLSKFESSEVLRLLPKCKHAFHVECVDTWLEAHSTCPLCRYRVDPEDILLVVEETTPTPLSNQIQNQNQKQENDECDVEIERGKTRNEIVEYYRKRHSSVGEKEWERERERKTTTTSTTSFRWSLDSYRKKNENSSVGLGVGLGIGLGCLVGPRKDGMLLTKEEEKKEERCSVEARKRLEHRIIVSPTETEIRSGLHRNQRWSDVEACDMLYLTSEMMIMRVKKNNESCWNGRGVINSRSVSEITGLSRFKSNQ